MKRLAVFLVTSALGFGLTSATAATRIFFEGEGVFFDSEFDSQTLLLGGVGETSSLAVAVSGIPDTVDVPGLSSFLLVLNFDPAVLELLNPNSSRPYTPSDPDWLINSTGRFPVPSPGTGLSPGELQIEYGSLDLTGSGSPPSGDGLLAAFELKRLAPGKTTISFSEVTLRDTGDAEPIPVESAATLQVVPLPGAAVALLSALGVLLVGARRRSA